MITQLLIEQANPTQVTKENKKLMLHGLYLLGDRPGGNNRLYDSKRVLDPAVGRIQERIKSGTMFGSLGHLQMSYIEPSKISHIVKSLTKKGSDYHGVSEVIAQGDGKILRSIIQSGGSLGISVKGSGVTKRNPRTQIDEVQDVPPYQIHSLDVVALPSSNHNCTAIYECITETLKGQELSPDDLHSRTNEILAAIFSQLPAELRAQQEKYGIPWNKTMGRYQLQPGEPDGDKTFLQQLQSDKQILLQKLAELQRQIELQNDQNGLAADRFAAYSKLIAQTSNPIKKNILQRECRNILVNHSTITETIKLLKRHQSHGLSARSPNTLIESIRANAGTRLSDGSKEEEAITEWYEKNK